MLFVLVRFGFGGGITLPVFRETGTFFFFFVSVTYIFHMFDLHLILW